MPKLPPISVAPRPPAADPGLASLPRIGLILLATDLTTERDVARLVGPDEAGVHSTRVNYVNPTTPENLRGMAPRLSEAAALLAPGEPLRAIAYGCTSASVVIGEAEVARVIGRGRPGVPVVTPIGAAKAAFRHLGVQRIAVLTPYLSETTAPVVEHFADAGFAVLSAHCLGLEDDRDMAKISADALVDAARIADHPDAEALFVSCTALPALVVAERLEAALGKPVVTSNQAVIWALRRHSGLDRPAAGFGRLMRETGAVPA